MDTAIASVFIYFNRTMNLHCRRLHDLCYELAIWYHLMRGTIEAAAAC